MTKAPLTAQQIDDLRWVVTYRYYDPSGDYPVTECEWPAVYLLAEDATRSMLAWAVETAATFTTPTTDEDVAIEARATVERLTQLAERPPGDVYRMVERINQALDNPALEGYRVDAILVAIESLLDMTRVADRLGYTYVTIADYHNTGKLPPPDRVIGRSPAWLPATIDAWAAARPGRGRGARRRSSPAPAFSSRGVVQGEG